MHWGVFENEKVLKKSKQLHGVAFLGKRRTEELAFGLSRCIGDTRWLLVFGFGLPVVLGTFMRVMTGIEDGV